MKRISAGVLLAFLLTVIMPTIAFAVSTDTYTIDELDMSIAIPSDYVVFTRDIDANDPNLSLYGLTKDSMSSLMTSGNIYLNAWDSDVNYEIIVTMIDSSLGDFNLLSDTTLSTLATSFESEYKSAGITYIKSEVYQHDQAKFLKIYISQPNGDSTAYGLQYYTVYADKAINITMQSYSGTINDSEENILKSIVDSAKFGTDPQVAVTAPASTSPFQYSDTKTGASFTVPANWSEEPLSAERETIDVKFTSNTEEGMCILYGSTDAWAAMSTSERSGYTRSDFDNSVFSKADIAEMYGVSASDVSVVLYNGNEYYCVETTNSSSSYGLDVTVTMTQVFRVENGYMYLFQFSGHSNNEYYDDFESLMKSVNYKSYNADTSTNGQSISDEYNVGSIILSLIITIVIYSLPIIIYRYAIRKSPVEPRKAKKITIIYGIAAFIVMSILIFTINESGAAGGAILLWSYVNYQVLTGGTSKSSASSSQETIYDDSVIEAQGKETNNTFELLNEEELSTQKTTCEQEPLKNNPTAESEEMTDIQQEPEIMYCHKCGNKLLPGSLFCPKCGTQVPNKDRE